MKIAIACDHAGFAGRASVADLAKQLGHELLDLGPADGESVDYPDYAHKVASAVENGEADRGVLICGTGLGMSMAANRHAGVRAAVVTDEFTASMCRAHNNANVVCLGERVLGTEKLTELVRIFLEEEFEGGRHERRVGKIEI